jgi:hypothetical protein
VHPRLNHHNGLLRVGAWALASLIAATSGLLVLFHAFDQRAEAEQAVADERTEDESPNLDDPLPVEVARQEGERPLRQRDPFAPYPALPGAKTFEDLTPEERADVEAGQEWAEVDSGEPVHQAWKRATQFGLQRARAKSAERDIGLVDLGGAGVY